MAVNCPRIVAAVADKRWGQLGTDAFKHRVQVWQGRTSAVVGSGVGVWMGLEQLRLYLLAASGIGYVAGKSLHARRAK